MINVTSAWHRALASDERAWIEDIRIYNATDGYLYIGNNDIWMNGLVIDDAVSNDTDFQLGCAIVNRLDLTINNIYGAYSKYDFTDCDVFVKIGIMTENGIEKISKGRYVTNGATYNGNLIHLECLDYMSYFDVPFSEAEVTFPATLRQILQKICIACSMTLGTDTFPHYDYEIPTAPDDDKLTCREMISYVAQVAGCFAKVTTNTSGQIRLELKWYNQAALESALDGLDGGVFDGISVGTLSSYFNTETGMTELSSSAATDTWFNVSNSVGFFFNGEVYDNIYIDSDSCFAFGNEEPSNHGHTALKDINVNTAEGQSVLIKYQEISYGSKNAIKIKYKGYTGRGSSKQTEYYLNEYEIFFVDDGSIVINFIALPDELNVGENRIIENNVECRFVPSTSSALIAYKDSGSWITDSVSSTYQTGDTADGGSFNPWSTGYEYDGGTFSHNNNVHFIQSLYTKNISVDDVIITGVSVTLKTDDTSNPVETHMTGTSGYVVSLEGNPLITKTNYSQILAWLGTQLIGFTFRKADITHASDPSIEAGDVAVIFDSDGNAYPIIISRTTFSTGGAQKTISAAQTPARNSSARYSADVKNYIAAHKAVRAEKSARELADASIRAQLNAGGGLYLTTETETDAQQQVKTIYYFHNNPNKSESDRQIKFSDAGIAVTANGTEPDPPEGTGVTWYGLTVGGDMLVNLLSTTGFLFDWAKGGDLTLGGANNTNGRLFIENASGQEIGRWTNDGIQLLKGLINLGNGNFVADTNGAVTAKSLTADDYVYVDGNSDSYFKIPTGSSCYVEIKNTGSLFRGLRDTVGIYADVNGADGINVFKSNSSHGYVPYTHVSAGGIGLFDSSGSTMITGSAVVIVQGTSYALTYGNGKLEIVGSLVVNGSNYKSRLFPTTDYGERHLYCLETPTPMFNDVGEGQIGDDGYCYVTIDPIFSETISSNQYQVFLQNYGEGECYVFDRKAAYFIVKGTPNMRFAWEIKGKQADFDQYRLESNIRNVETKNQIDYTQDAINHITEIQQERMPV